MIRINIQKRINIVKIVKGFGFEDDRIN